MPALRRATMGGMDAQTYRERPPARVLARHVSSVWVQQVPKGAPPYEHRTVPHGSIEVAVELGSLPRVVGPQTRPLVETLASGATVVGLRFHPGAAPPVLRIPASELVDHSVDWWDRSAAALGETMAAAPSPDHAAVLLERAMLDLVAGADRLDPVVTETVRALLPWGTADVAALPDALHISERQLRRRTAAAIGLAPKVVQRMLRFQGFLALAHARPHARLALLAADTGYADQPHLTRESLRLAGLTPRALLDEAAEHCVGLHDHSASRMPLLRTRALRKTAGL